MRRLWLALALVAASPRAFAGSAQTARPASRIILPGSPVDPADAVIAPSVAIILPAAPSLVIPQTTIVAPAPLIIPASRALTESEAEPATTLSQDALKSLVESLTSADAAGDQRPGSEGSEDPLSAAFDGNRLPDTAPAREYFAAGPLAPSLPRVEGAARSLWSLLLPGVYRRIPMALRYDRSGRLETGHTWTSTNGHAVEIAPIPADSRGEVATAFGLVGETRVQQKTERLMIVVHEYAHVLFDFAVRKTENHPPDSAYSAMTEGFAVALEPLFIDRLLSRPEVVGLSPRDAADFSALAAARRRWLAAVESHYSEGYGPWRAAYERDGEQGLLAFLASLSAERMAAIPRADPAYQLAVGDPELLSAYLGRDPDFPARRGLEAFAKAASGTALTDGEAQDAAAAIERAGPAGRRRLFERALLADKRLKNRQGSRSASRWWRDDAEPLEPAFALARLSPVGAADLARFLAEIVSAPGGAERLFEGRGPNKKTIAVISGAEALPWDADSRESWTNALTSWILTPF